MMSDVRIDRSRTESIVGREPELAALLRSATGVEGAVPARMVLVSGDAGVGKTRLVGEVLDRLAEQGWSRLVGHCLDFGDASMPYLPFAEMLGQLPEETRVHPALERLRHGDSPSTSGPGEGLDRAEVFEAMAALVESLAAARSLVLVVEDAHWADASTRDLISFLIARRLSGRCVVLVTFRSDEMHRRHPLRQRVAEWVRLPGVERVQVDPLPPGAVRTMVEEIIGRPEAQHDADIERIVQRAQGNAFYVEELVGAFLGGGWSLPEDLADLLLVRLERLGDPARQLVRVAAAAGQRVSHDLLTHVTRLSGNALDAALREAIESNVLVRTEDSAYSFRHALLGEAVYDDLLPGERMRLHTSYAEAVRELLGSRGAAELARHALASHDLPTALLASIDAGDQALATGGPDEAARHFTTALEIFGRATLQLEQPPDEAELVGRTVDALCSAGRPETALALVDSHLAALPARAPALTRARLLLARVEAIASTETEVRPSLISQEALDLVGPEPTPLRARILSLHVKALVWDDDFEAARACADEALELADALGLPRLAADVNLSLTWLDQHLDLGEGSRAELRRIIEESRARGDTLSELRGHLRTGGVESEHGALVAAQAAFVRTTRMAREMGRPWMIQGISARTQAGVLAFMRGQWDEALRIADHATEDPPPTARAMLDSVTLLVAAGRGDQAALLRLPSVRERWHREGMVAVVAGGAAIELLCRRDGADAAVAMYDEVVRVLSPLWGDDFDALVRLASLGVAALADDAPRTPTGGRAAVSATGVRLVRDAERALTARAAEGRPFGAEGRAWEARLRAEQQRLDWLLGLPVRIEEMTTAWRGSSRAFGDLGHVFEEARSRARLATVLRASGDLEAAREQAVAARAVAARLGAAPLLEEIGGSTRATVHSDPLTPREREILTLVADGRSNGEIGKRLFISAKTVSVHVSNVMAKLGASSRTEAAALARRTGLVE